MFGLWRARQGCGGARRVLLGRVSLRPVQERKESIANPYQHLHHCCHLSFFFYHHHHHHMIRIKRPVHDGVEWGIRRGAWAVGRTDGWTDGIGLLRAWVRDKDRGGGRCLSFYVCDCQCA